MQSNIDFTHIKSTLSTLLPFYSIGSLDGVQYLIDMAFMTALFFCVRDKIYCSSLFDKISVLALIRVHLLNHQLSSSSECDFFSS